MDNILAYTLVGSIAVIGGIVLRRRKNKKPKIELVGINGVGIENFNDKEDLIISTHPVLNPNSVLFENDLKTARQTLEELSNQIDNIAVEHVKESSPSEVVNKTEEIKGRIKVLEKKRKDKVKAKKKKTVKGK